MTRVDDLERQLDFLRGERERMLELIGSLEMQIEELDGQIAVARRLADGLVEALTPEDGDDAGT